MDLMTLAAKIVLDDSSYTKGISAAEKSGQQLANKMSAMTVAVGNIAADMIKKAVSSISNVVSSAVSGYADYEQLIGGVETLFKSSADKVANYAKKSYKTTGLSANKYMETVTSFSASLLQGLNGDTEKAADMADMAITDMADNANKMGTDISSIQAAYQGFAKQNYTMLDNLKLGYGGTKDEMVRLINDSKTLDHEIDNLDDVTFDQIVAALHQIQSEMGITGTTAKEASETISGSKASMEAAWADFMSAVAGEGNEQRLKETQTAFEKAFQTYVDNLAPVLETSIKNAPRIIDAVTNAITSLPGDAISKLTSGGIGALTSIFQNGTEIAGWLIDGLVEMFNGIIADPSQIAELGESIGTFIGSTISDIVTNLPTIAGGLITAGVTLAGSLIDGLREGLFGSGEIDKIGKEMDKSIEDASVKALKSDAILKYMQDLATEYGTGAEQTEKFKEAQRQLKEYLGDKVDDVFLQYGSNVQAAIDKLKEFTQQMRITAINEAMRKSWTQLYELLGEKTGEKAVSEVKQEIAQRTIDEYPGLYRSNIQAYAAELLKQNEAAGGVLMDDQLEVYQKLLEGYDVATGKNLEDLDISELDNTFTSLAQTLEGLYDYLGTEENDTLWGKNRADEIYSEEEMEAHAQAVHEATVIVQQEAEAQKKLQEEIDAINDQIVITEQAMQNTATQYAEDAIAAKAAGEDLVGALSGVAAKISALSISGSTPNYIQEATGIESVPFNGFRASLHKGEMILTKHEAEDYRSGGGTAEMVGAIQELRGDMQNLRIVVGKKTFGQAVVDYGGSRTREYIVDYTDKIYSGYGT